jgi:hypothetical protein
MDANNNLEHVAKVKKQVLLAPSPGKATSSPSPTKVTWDADNDRKLFLLTFGRSIAASEHAQLSKAFPGSMTSSIRNRLGALHAEMRKMHESLEYEVPGVSAKKVSATPDKKSSAFLKRGVDEVNESEEEAVTPSKKAKRGTTPGSKSQSQKTKQATAAGEAVEDSEDSGDEV